MDTETEKKKIGITSFEPKDFITIARRICKMIQAEYGAKYSGTKHIDEKVQAIYVCPKSKKDDIENLPALIQQKVGEKFPWLMVGKPELTVSSGTRTIIGGFYLDILPKMCENLKLILTFGPYSSNINIK